PISTAVRHTGAGRKAMGGPTGTGIRRMDSAAVIPPDNVEHIAGVGRSELDERRDGALHIAEHTVRRAGTGGGPDGEHGSSAEGEPAGERSHILREGVEAGCVRE